MYKNFHKVRVHTGKCEKVVYRGQYPSSKSKIDKNVIVAGNCSGPLKGKGRCWWTWLVVKETVLGRAVASCASRRKASEASRKIIGVSESNFSVELLVVQDKCIDKVIHG